LVGVRLISAASFRQSGLARFDTLNGPTSVFSSGVFPPPAWRAAVRQLWFFGIAGFALLESFFGNDGIKFELAEQ
jgi:hypothetical protein